MLYKLCVAAAVLGLAAAAPSSQPSGAVQPEEDRATALKEDNEVLISVIDGLRQKLNHYDEVMAAGDKDYKSTWRAEPKPARVPAVPVVLASACAGDEGGGPEGEDADGSTDLSPSAGAGTTTEDEELLERKKVEAMEWVQQEAIRQELEVEQEYALYDKTKTRLEARLHSKIEQ